MKNLTDYLGFYFVMFQRDISNMFVRCWIDGSEDSELFFIEDFFKLFEKEENSQLVYKAKKALTETSIFLWDIEAGTITRLSATQAENSNIGAYIKSRAAEELKDRSPNSRDPISNVMEVIKTTLNQTFNPFKK